LARRYDPCVAVDVAVFSPAADRRGGCFTCCHLGERIDAPVSFVRQAYHAPAAHTREEIHEQCKPSLAIGRKQEGKFLRGAFDIVLAKGF